MLRTTTPWCITFATFGRCSLIWRPGTLVGIGLNSPAPLLSGLRSKVSLWLGPPSIQSRMQLLCLRAGGLDPPVAAAAWLARTFSQPDIETAPTPTPAADSRR